MSDIPIIKADEPFKIVFLKGATGSGRKTAAKILHEKSPFQAVVDAFAFEMRERCHAAFKLFGQDRLPAPPMHFDGRLHEKLDEFGGLTPFSAYTEFQNFITRTLGQEAMGQWVVDRLGFYKAVQQQRNPNGQHAEMALMVDDAPYSSYKTVVDHFGAHNCTLMLVSRQGSSAAPLDLGMDVRVVRVNNPGDTEAGFESAIRKAAPHLFIKIAKTLPQ